MSSSASSRARALARAQIAGAVLVAAVLAMSAASASARSYTAPPGKVLVGVTGGRTVDGYVQASGKPPAVFQFFVAWGDQFGYAYRRAEQAHAALSLHLSTYNGPGTQERITPRAIALGHGDDYLMSLTRAFAAHARPVYLRPFGEMNNAENPYSAFGRDGRSRGVSHSRSWFRQAWRRVYLIVNGGRVATINARLRGLGLPGLRRRSIHWLPQPHVAVQWTPMTAGAPNIAANAAAQYWPGARYVDWVGTDFYSRFPNFSGLDRFYADPRYAGKPFVFGEWAMWGQDDASFMRRFFDWVATHPRVQMLAYNQGNRTTGPFRLYRYPKASRVMRRALRSPRYLGRLPWSPPRVRGRMRKVSYTRADAGRAPRTPEVVRCYMARPPAHRAGPGLDVPGLLTHILGDFGVVLGTLLDLLAQPGSAAPGHHLADGCTSVPAHTPT
jgi:hypothetical protein